MTSSYLAAAIEHTNLKPTATEQAMIQLMEEALQWNFYAVCLPSCWLPLARSRLHPSSVKVVTVAGFPLGSSSTAAKCCEVEKALEQGADEVDFVLNIGWMKSGYHKLVEKEFRALVQVAADRPLKVILETCYLSNEEKKLACHLAVETGIAFVKTSTGFGTEGATLADVRLMRSITPRVKASGGIKDTKSALALMEAGACRLGTSSGVDLIAGLSDLSSQVKNKV